MKKVFSYGLIAIFLLANSCFAATLDPAKIIVPADSGRVVEVYKTPDPNAPLVVYMQDIHMNYEAQKAMAAVLETLIRDYGFDLLLTESKTAGLKDDFKYLREKAPQEARFEAAEKLLKDGTIACEDYLDLTTDYNFTVSGIENDALSAKQKTDHLAIFEKGGDTAKLVSSLQNIASNLKMHIYTKEMRDLDERTAAYNKDEISLVEYVQSLDGAARANNADLKALPNLALFVESANMESQIDFAAVETERETVATAVENAKIETGKVKEELAAKNAQFRSGEVSQGAYYAFLKDAAETAKIDLTPYKNLSLYTKYIVTYEKIDTTLLFKEIDQLVNQLKNSLAKTPEQKKLNQIDKGLTILSDMANTKLIPDEYAYYISNKADFNLDDWLAFLKNNSAKFNLTNPVPGDVSALKTNIPLMERFYATAIERDAAFVANIKTNLANLKKDKAILIIGGFHTANMKKLLKDSGFSYLIVAPRIDIVRDYENIYKERLKSDVELLRKTTGKQQ